MTGRISSDRMLVAFKKAQTYKTQTPPKLTSFLNYGGGRGGMRSEFSRPLTVICSPVNKAQIDIIHTIHSLVFPVLIKEAEVFQLPQVVNVVSGVGYHTFRPILYEIGEK